MAVRFSGIAVLAILLGIAAGWTGHARAQAPIEPLKIEAKLPGVEPAALQYPKIDVPVLGGVGPADEERTVREALERLPVGSSVTLPEAAVQVIRFGPRYGVLNNAKSEKLPNEKDTQRVTYTGGLVIDVDYEDVAPGKRRKVNLAADHVVMWVKGVKTVNLADGLRVEKPKDAASNDGEKDDKKAKEADDEEKEKKVEVEFYLSGNVVIRFSSDETSQGIAQQTLRAEEIFYDPQRSKAIAVKGDLETKFPSGYDSIRLRGSEIWRTGVHEFRVQNSKLFSSKRPADPSLTMNSREAVLTEQIVARTNIFGQPYRNARTGEPDMGTQRILSAEENVVRIGTIPVGYFPKYRADITEPIGPLANLGFRSDRVYGLFQTYTSWNVFGLLGLRGAPGNQWLLHLDYLSERGPGVGTDFLYRDLFGPEFRNVGDVSVYGLFRDSGQDILGGFRGPEPEHPEFRSRFIWTHNQDIYESGTSYTRYQGQFAYLSDKNFFEQFYQLRFSGDPNQETFAYLYGARGNMAWNVLGQANVNRPWVTETQWLPRAEASIVGESFFDLFSYTSRASLGYALFRPADATQTPAAVTPGDQSAVDTGRADWHQRLSVPVDLGPFRLEPYGAMALTGYTEDQTGDSRARFYGGGGAKLTLPLSKLYRDVQNETLNMRGLYHKIEFGLNYFNAYSDTDPSTLPQLDRLNDDVSDYSYRAFRRFGGLYEAPGQSGILFADTPAGIATRTSPIFDPERLANRRLLQSRTDVLDSMHALQMEVRQRWQTKRGPEGNEHTVDWMTLNVGATYFPDRNRDNYGHSFGLLNYDYSLLVGDRTAITSSGWFETHEEGTRAFNLGIYFNRPDGTNLYLGYRHTDPINSRLLVLVLGYQFSQKYSVSLINALDLSNNFAQTSSIAFNRTGTDMTMSLGISYNAFQNNLGLQFLLVPNGALVGRGGNVGNLFLQ